MKRSLIALVLSAFAATSVFAEASVCTNTNLTNPVTQMDLGKDDSAKLRFCNNHPTAKMYENSIVTSNGGVENQREMAGFLVDELIEIPACSCYDILIQRDPDEALENKAGFFWLKVTEIKPSTSASDTAGSVIDIRISMMPVFTYGNDVGDVAKLSAVIDNKRLLVKNSGARPGRIVAINIDGKKIDMEKIFIFPGSVVDLTKKLPVGIADIVGSKKLQLIDWIDREVPVI